MSIVLRKGGFLCFLVVQECYFVLAACWNRMGGSLDTIAAYL